MKVTLGYNSAIKNNLSLAEVNYDTLKLINGHALIMGASGTGKTFLIRKLTSALNEEALKSKVKMRSHIIDVHGDIDIDSASSVKFSESTPYGFNPLKINAHHDYGGVRKRIQSFIYSLTSIMFHLGVNQVSMLRNLLIDLFEKHGIFEDDPSTWDIQSHPMRTNPTIQDLVNFTQDKLNAMYIGDVSVQPSEASIALQKLNKSQNKLYNLLRQKNKNNEEADKIADDIEKQKQRSIELFAKYVNNISTGNELSQILRYDSLDTLKSLLNHISNLNNIGIFKDTSPPFNLKSPTWRYDIKALSTQEKKLFVNFLCEQLFFKAMEKGETDEIRDIVFLDEGHLFTSDEPNNPINVISKEGRKYGLALIIGSQSPKHFSEDFLSNVATKIILGIDQTFWNTAINKLKIKEDDLKKWIVVHKQILIQTKLKGSANTDFVRAFSTKEGYLDFQKRISTWQKNNNVTPADKQQPLSAKTGQAQKPKFNF